MAAIGVIGGSGLYDMDGLTNLREMKVETPFGEPSDALLMGELDGIELAFLPRHGRGHRYNPSEVNYRANIFAMKSIGVEHIISVSAVGSLQAAVHPGHIVVIDQFIDRTKGRAATFYDGGIVGHVSFGDPVCGALREHLLAACREEAASFHDGGIYVCMEGPAFSTRAESNLYRSWGARVIGMTNLPEAKLAREAEMSYATLAMVTDFDCWHEEHDDVSVDQVIAVLKANVSLAKRVIARAVPAIAASGPSPQRGAMEFGIMTSPDLIPADKRAALAALVGKYLG